jgi:hypothetical protein
MSRSLVLLGAALVASLLSACGSDTGTSTPAASTAHGSLAFSPPFRIASADAATFQAQLTAISGGSKLLQLTGNPTCGVDFYYIKYWTRGALNEATESSGALMVPTGAAPACSGPRPIVLYSHGTQFLKTANIADITDPNNTEGALIAAMFAAQGYIVVAPNYAGYDISTLGYHPFLNAAQQSGEMIDALTAARTALPTTFAASTSDNGKLFVTGYSEGGYVAMATERAMETAGMMVTAAAPMSGPYALEALFDTVIFGSVDLGSTLFTPLVTSSYQHAYSNVYTTPSEFYSSTYANGIETILPSTQSTTQLISAGLLPQLALFDSTPPMVSVPNNPTQSAALTTALSVPAVTSELTFLYAAGFGNPYLVNNNVRVNYALDEAADPDGIASGSSALAASPPTNGLRKDLYMNDMRNGGWAPTAPTLLCGGENDPTVFFAADTGVMESFWANLPAGTVTVLDVDPASGPSGVFAPLQAAFQASQASQLAYLQTPAGGGLSAEAAAIQMVENYHGTAVPPFCSLAARYFFASF